MNGYAVAWSDPGGTVRVGKLELEQERLRLEGTTERSVPYGEIRGVRVGRQLSERVGGRPTVLLELVSGAVLAIASLAGPGTLNELVERLTAARLAA